MGLSVVAEKGNRPTSRAEYHLSRETARDGAPVDGHGRGDHLRVGPPRHRVFGYTFGGPEIDAPGIFWEDYVPGVQIGLRQGKTGDAQVIPLRGDPERLPAGVHGPTRPGTLLYPALEEELARMDRAAGHIVISEKTGRRYREDDAGRLFRRIRKAAGLPVEMTLTGFRHGGATELGEAGVDDIRSISGHRTLQQTATYNKATERKARSAGEKRLEHARAGR